MQPTANPKARAYVGARYLAHIGRKYIPIEMPKPMRMPSIAIAGNSATCVSTPPTICVVTGVADQPTAADAMSSTSSTVVRLMTPRTVIPPRHCDTGPSVIGSVPAAFGGAQVVPPGLGGFGAAQPALASAIAFS